ncbi:MAG: glycoside hydrolase family 127 protein [Agriterribacter sp.]
MRTIILFIVTVGLLHCIGFSQSWLPQKDNSKFSIKPSAQLKAYAFNLKDVKLIEGSAFKHAMDIDERYILSLKPEKLLSRFYTNVGLKAKDSVYGGWESEGLSGHTLGHYLSACAMMYAATGSLACKERVDMVVRELSICQDARKTGYIGAIPKEDAIFYPLQRGEIKSGGFDLNGGWSPWYTVHKVMAGLVDAYLYCDNKQALAVVKKMADWTGTIVNPLTDEQRQKMLKCEFGGMNDVLANIYSITGNKKYLDLSYKFYDDFVMQPLADGKDDPIAGKHSNTNIPKAIGSARLFELTSNKADETIATRMWNIIVDAHTYANGGNGNYEYFGQPRKLSDALSDNTAESCAAYNMLKLTGHLFCWNPDSKLADYYERALYNDILASQHPQTAMMLYFEPLRMGSKKQYSDSVNTFTCCVGSGMENHAKYAEDIYFEGSDGSLFVNLFIPSTLNWSSKKISITQNTDYPNAHQSTFTIHGKQPVRFSMRIRSPWWLKEDAAITVNNKKTAVEKDKLGYFVITRQWHDNDKIEISMPMTLYTESLPDNSNRIAVLYGPLLMAGNLGDTMPDPVYGTPVLLTDNRNVQDWAVHDNANPLVFHMKGVGKPFDVTLSPFYKNIDNYYSVYWDYFTNTEWNARQSAYEAEKKYQKEIEERTVDIMRLGEMQPERDHNLQASEFSYASDAFGRTGREVRKNGFFSFSMKVLPNGSNTLLCTYIGDDKNRQFDILVDDIKIATVELTGGTAGKFFDKEYLIPVDITNNKSSVVIKIQSINHKTAGRVFGCRIIKK